jgi:chemotaxis signal transduction protein
MKDSNEDLNTLQLCTFNLADRLYGVDIADVKEISPWLTFTPVFHAPKVVKGYVNIRGRIHLVINLRSLLGLEEIQGEETRLVLFKPSTGEAFGVLVDCVGEVVNVCEDEIVDRRHKKLGPPDGDEQRQGKKGLVRGICKLPERLLVVLNAKSFLEAING